MSLVRRAVLGAAAVALTSSVVVAPAHAAPAPTESRAAATWLKGQLTKGAIHNEQYDFVDYGLTADAGLALVELGQKRPVRAVSKALKKGATAYTTGEASGTSDLYAGATAKLAVFAQRSGADPRAFGTDLIAQLEGLTTDSGATRGRIADVSEYGDYANTLGQAYAVEALDAAGSAEAGAALDYLLAQQCRSGSFRLYFAAPDAAGQACDDAKGKAKAPDTDATATAVLTLSRLEKQTKQTRRAVKKAVRWLGKAQRANGAFGGGVQTEKPNANSTGLAAQALQATGRCVPARKAAAWLRTLQVTDQVTGETGAVAYDAASLKAATRKGITTKTQDQWRRATAQAAPGLAAASCTRG